MKKRNGRSFIKIKCTISFLAKLMPVDRLGIPELALYSLEIWVIFIGFQFSFYCFDLKYKLPTLFIAETSPTLTSSLVASPNLRCSPPTASLPRSSARLLAASLANSFVGCGSATDSGTRPMTRRSGSSPGSWRKSERSHSPRFSVLIATIPSLSNGKCLCTLLRSLASEE